MKNILFLSLVTGLFAQDKFDVAAVIQEYYWAGGYADPMQISCQVSTSNKNTLQVLSHSVMSSTEVEFDYTVYDYDQSARTYYKACHADGVVLLGLVLESGGEMVFYIDTDPNEEIVSPQNYNFTIGIMPQTMSQDVHVAVSATNKFVKKWGVEVAGKAAAAAKTAAELSYSCSISQGFNFQKDVQDLVGFVNSMSIGPEELAADFEVTDPESYGGGVPVTLSSFTARAAGTSVVLAWETVSEQNNLGWHVERSADIDGPYERVSDRLIAGAVNSTLVNSYGFTDEGAGSGTWYFRLRQVDATGAVTFTAPVMADVPVTYMTDPGLIRIQALTGDMEVYSLDCRRRGRVRHGVYLVKTADGMRKTVVVE